MQLFDPAELNWVQLKEGDNFDYPIDYAFAVLNARDDGHIDVVFRWEPHSYCHFHRHLVDTTTTVLQGEHHLIEMDHGVELEHKVRTAGDYSHKPAGDVHMEYAGPEGSMLLFNMHAPDGRLFEILDKDENVLAVATTEQLVAGELS